MFLDFFYGLRGEGVKVSLQEWRALLEAMEKGLHGSSLERFYHLGRSCLIKSANLDHLGPSLRTKQTSVHETSMNMKNCYENR